MQFILQFSSLFETFDKLRDKSAALPPGRGQIDAQQKTFMTATSPFVFVCKCVGIHVFVHAGTP